MRNVTAEGLWKRSGESESSSTNPKFLKNFSKCYLKELLIPNCYKGLTWELSKNHSDGCGRQQAALRGRYSRKKSAEIEGKEGEDKPRDPRRLQTLSQVKH